MNAKPKYRYGHLQMNPFVSACCSSIAATRCKWCLLLHQRTGLEALYSYLLTDSKTEAAPVVYSSAWGMLHVPKVCITVLLMQHSLLWLCRGSCFCAALAAAVRAAQQDVPSQKVHSPGRVNRPAGQLLAWWLNAVRAAGSRPQGAPLLAPCCSRAWLSSIRCISRLQ